VQIGTDAMAKISERARSFDRAFRTAFDRARKRNWINLQPGTLRLIFFILLMAFAVGILVLSVLFIFVP
jgi:hypothetical protein